MVAALRFSLLLLGALGAAAFSASDDFAAPRREMVQVIRGDFEATAAHLGHDELYPNVAAALMAVPRHEFVESDLRPHAYENRPLPIGYGQTISQPYIVAAMTQLLELKPNERALEVGTGSGYQAAILTQLGARVFTIEPESGVKNGHFKPSDD